MHIVCVPWVHTRARLGVCVWVIYHCEPVEARNNCWELLLSSYHMGLRDQPLAIWFHGKQLCLLNNLIRPQFNTSDARSERRCSSWIKKIPVSCNLVQCSSDCFCADHIWFHRLRTQSRKTDPLKTQTLRASVFSICRRGTILTLSILQGGEDDQKDHPLSYSEWAPSGEWEESPEVLSSGHDMTTELINSQELQLPVLDWTQQRFSMDERGISGALPHAEELLAVDDCWGKGVFYPRSVAIVQCTIPPPMLIQATLIRCSESHTKEKRDKSRGRAC